MNTNNAANESRWEVEWRNGGEFLVSRAGAKLCRIDRDAGVILFWDKRTNREIPVSLTDLIGLFEAKPK